ncbi:hypothetical protein JCM10212_002572 [Sporobolomyces blumeae]
MAACSLPIVDLDAFLADPTAQEGIDTANLTARALIEYGALVVRDSRVSDEANEAFLDLMEDYFAQPDDVKRLDLRPEVHYQVGVTLENTEKPKCHSNEACQAVIAALDPSERPLDLSGRSADPKCRFFHRMGTTPRSTAFPALNLTNVVPCAFPEWTTSLESWGSQIKRAVEGVSEMLAVGLGLERDALTDAARYGSHLLAPTATDLEKYGREGEVFAGFHTDLNFLTIHGRSRYPGLNVWARNTGKRIEVKLPPGCLLVQAGKQLEHLTGGLILAGYHEVICTSGTLSALSNRSRADAPTRDRPKIRISSTFFYHLSNDYALRPRAFHERVKRARQLARVGGGIRRDRPEGEEGQERDGVLSRWDKEWDENVAGAKYEEGLLVGDLIQNELKEIALHA